MSWTSDNYSRMEQELINLLLNHRNGLDTKQLVQLYYKDAPPPSARHSLSTVMNNLIKKVRSRREAFSIHKSERAGPHPIVYWIDGSAIPVKANPATEASRSALAN
jgi:hypothetical protein